MGAHHPGGRCAARGAARPTLADRASASDFDHGTQRAILKLYRSAPPDVLAAAGERLGELAAPALVVWGERATRTSATEFAHAYAERARRAGASSRWWRRRALAVARPPAGGGAASRAFCSAASLVRRVLRRPPRHGAVGRSAESTSDAASRIRSRAAAMAACSWRARRCRGRCCAVVYLTCEPRTVDLAAHVYRAEPVRTRGLHDLERQLVRRPPHARLQRAVPAARVAARARSLARRRRRRASRPRCSSRSPAATSASGRAGARSGSASARPRCCSPAGCRSRLGVAFGLGRAAGAPAAARRARGRARGGVLPAGSPVAGLFLALAGVAVAAGRRAPAARLAARGAPRSCPLLLLALAFPEGGQRAVRASRPSCRADALAVVL